MDRARRRQEFTKSCIHRLREGEHPLYHGEGGDGEGRGQGCRLRAEKALAFLEYFLENRHVCGISVCLMACALLGSWATENKLCFGGSISGLQTSLAPRLGY